MLGAIIQARMTSHRFPGKVLAEVKGRPLLDYLLERLSFVKPIKQVILATTVNNTDDPLAQYADRKKIPCFRGSENNVLERYWLAADKFDVDPIMRITADCPLLDPQICSRLIETYIAVKADYAHLSPNYSEGLDCEIFSRQALKQAYEHADRKSELEHVTQYFHNHKDIFHIHVLENETNDGEYRFTVDEPEDFDVVRSIIEHLYKEGSRPFGASETKRFLDEHPTCRERNKHIIRNEGLIISLRNDERIDGR